VNGSNWHRLANNADEFPEGESDKLTGSSLVEARAAPKVPRHSSRSRPTTEEW
jgi:hypothetical protein